jgi:hypothetical protein
VAILEEKGQVAGLELQSSLLLCHHPAFRTHLKDVLVVIHPDNVSSIVGTHLMLPKSVTLSELRANFLFSM